MTSGLHSGHYLQCAKVSAISAACRDVRGSGWRRQFRQGAIDAVISPAIGGIVLGQEVARALASAAIFGEREARRDDVAAGLPKWPLDERFIMWMITTTGGSVREIIHVVRQAPQHSRGRRRH